jgi:hypothetical protein
MFSRESKRRRLGEFETGGRVETETARPVKAPGGSGL